MSLVVWLLVGALAGAVYAALYFRRPFAFLGSAALGAFGAFVGGFVFQMTALRATSQFHGVSIAAAFLGAMLILGGFQVLRRAGHGD